MSAERGLASLGGAGPQASLPACRAAPLVLFASLLCGRDGPQSAPDAPPERNDDASPWTVAQLEVHGPSRRLRRAAGLFVRAVLCTTSDLALFLPVTEPIRAAGMGEAPRLGDRLGLEKAEDEAAPSWVLARRRLRGRMDDASESWAAGRRVLEDEVRDGFIASGILRTKPGASTHGNNGSESGGASDRGRSDHGSTMRDTGALQQRAAAGRRTG